MKKTYKVLSVLMVVLMIAFTCTNVFATNVLDLMTGTDTSVDTTAIGNVGNKIFTIITSVAMVIAIIILAILGVKYMMGSTEEKAEYKKTMIPYLVGAILVFGAGAIGKAVIGVAQTIAIS